jgi:sugar lactone lactonase YvrE
LFILLLEVELFFAKHSSRTLLFSFQLSIHVFIPGFTEITTLPATSVKWICKANEPDFLCDKVKEIYACLILAAPSRGTDVALTPAARWSPEGITVAGGHGEGNAFNQLFYSWGLCIDDNGTVYVADQVNHRIVAWSTGAVRGRLVAGGNGDGNELHQLSWPRDVAVDRSTKNNILICDRDNRRVVRWPRDSGTQGEVLISNIDCWGLTMDDRGFLYVSNIERHEVRRYRLGGDFEGTLVAGGNGKGNDLHQLNNPNYIFVDRDYSLYVSDDKNHRVMKWTEGAREGLIVAGGNQSGDNMRQLCYPRGVLVDGMGTVYVADSGNGRVMRWPQGATQGSAVVGGNDVENRRTHLNGPMGLSFDRHGHLYVVDHANSRVQKFELVSV